MLRAERRFSRGLKIRITIAGVSPCIAGSQEFCHARALTLTAHAKTTLEGIEAGGGLDETTTTVRPGEDTRDVLDETVGLEVSARVEDRRHEPYHGRWWSQGRRGRWRSGGSKGPSERWSWWAMCVRGEECEREVERREREKSVERVGKWLTKGGGGSVGGGCRSDEAACRGRAGGSAWEGSYYPVGQSVARVTEFSSVRHTWESRGQQPKVKQGHADKEVDAIDFSSVVFRADPGSTCLSESRWLFR